MTFLYCNVANGAIYGQPKFRSQIDSEVLLWEKVELLEKERQFSRVRAEDGYVGWVNNLQLVEAPVPADGLQRVTRMGKVYREADENSGAIRDVVCGCRVAVKEEFSGWQNIVLPDGEKGFIRNELTQKPQGSNAREIMLNVAPKLLGVPYYWGGKSDKGLDCSGYMQLLHKLAGIGIRRDSPMQFEDARPVAKDPLGGKPGDLLFFSENGTRITHVGLKISDNEFIHARGMVRINSVEKGNRLYDETLMNSFVEIRSFVP